MAEGFRLWFEKSPGKGEDAFPLRISFSDGTTFLGVSDGLGGSGSAEYEWKGEMHSMAWLAARTVRCVVSAFVRDCMSNRIVPDAEYLAAELVPSLQFALRALAAETGAAPSRLKSSLIRRMPATLTALWAEPVMSGTRRVHVWQAGDSRAYALSPRGGLMQLSRDHTKTGADAFLHLLEGSPMSNCISADGSFFIQHTTHEIADDALLLVATDGCFDFLRFPAQWEIFLLESWSRSGSISQWRQRLRDYISAVTCDDASLALMLPASPDVAAFASRLNELYDQYMKPFLQAEKNGTSGEVAAAHWQNYKTGYERNMAALPLTEPV